MYRTRAVTAAVGPAWPKTDAPQSTTTLGHLDPDEAFSLFLSQFHRQHHASIHYIPLHLAGGRRSRGHEEPGAVQYHYVNLLDSARLGGPWEAIATDNDLG